MDQNNKPSLAGAETRRHFIKKAATAAAVVAATNPFQTPVYGQNSAPSPGRVIGANDRIAVGYIGIGGPPSNCPGMGLAHVDSQKSHAAENNIAQAAVCDLYKKRNEIAKEKIGAGDVTTHDDYRKSKNGEWNYSIDTGATPETLDWNKWLGKVHNKIPFNPDHFFRWRKYYPYCTGLLGDLVPHRLLPLMLATGNPEFPSRVVCLGAKAWASDQGTPGALERDVPEHVELLAQFPSG